MRPCSAIVGRGALIAVLVLLLGLPLAYGEPKTPDEMENPDRLRQSADLHGQRRHAWSVIDQLFAPSRGYLPAFEFWYGQDQVFAAGETEQRPFGIHGFLQHRADLRVLNSTVDTADAPVITYTFFNSAAYHHIRTHHLYLRAELDRLKRGMVDRGVQIEGDAIDAFPKEAIVIKTAWWPVAHGRLTALPVWDPADNPPSKSGNGFFTWRRAVAVDTGSALTRSVSAAIDFAGQIYPRAHRVNVGEFYRVKLDQAAAMNLNNDRVVKKAASIALGRPLEEGDMLLLVGANIASKEIDDWIWVTIWWHDRATQGPFSEDRPQGVSSPIRHYLLQTAFDADRPYAADGGPHVCFNPWMEGRFPDGGQGSGILSNCLGCHARASYPPVGFLPVTRGAPDVSHDIAFAGDRLRTQFMWGIALHAR